MLRTVPSYGKSRCSIRIGETILTTGLFERIINRIDFNVGTGRSIRKIGGFAVITCASIYTYEVDDGAIALAELKAQLDEKITLLENTVGIIMCHTEFIQTGALKFVCENLPFDLVGATTASQAVNGEAGELMLTIFVITSDDVQFRAGITPCLDEGIAEKTKAAYDQVAKGMPDKPKLVLVFPTITMPYTGDTYIDVWGQIAPDTPIFGTPALDDTLSFAGSETIYNGASDRAAMSFVLCYGNINPRFLIGTFPKNNVTPYEGEITKSDGSIVYEINNINAYQYLKELGFAGDDIPVKNFLFVPFQIDFKSRSDYDGVAVMRVLSYFTAEGAAVFRGNMDENSRFVFSTCSPEDVLATVMQKIEEVNAMPDVNGVLLLPCIVRRMVLGSTPLAESEYIRHNVKAPFMMGYAGGELCPTSVTDGIPTNRYHNYSLVILVI